MSADNWAVCPRCTARHDVGYRNNEFREDYSIYGAETGTVTVEYRGECHRCGLVLEFTTEHPIPDWQPANEPIGGEIPSQWGKVPAGWFVKDPKGNWWEVTSTYRVPEDPSGDWQMVSLLVGDQVAAFKRPPKGEVWARRGSLAPRDLSDAMASLEEAFTTAILRDGEGPMQS